VLVSLAGTGFSRLEDVSHFIYFTIFFYKFCTFSAICKASAVINCIALLYHL
jgi:hypothetical protein